MEKESHVLYLANQNRTIPHYHHLLQLLIAFGVPAAPAVDWLNADKSIHKATRAGHIEAVKQHIDAGTDVNAKNKYGETADLLRKHGGKTGKELEAEESIHAAARYGNIEAVKQHLAAGTDVDARDAEDKTPLQHGFFGVTKKSPNCLSPKVQM